MRPKSGTLCIKNRNKIVMAKSNGKIHPIVGIWHSSLLKSLENYNCNILFTAPNADTGSKYILDKIIKFISKNEKRYFYIPSLGQDLYLNALLLFDCIVGNS